jgi:hypothetical protein
MSDDEEFSAIVAKNRAEILRPLFFTNAAEGRGDEQLVEHAKETIKDYVNDTSCRGHYMCLYLMPVYSTEAQINEVASWLRSLGFIVELVQYRLLISWL